MSRRNWAFIRSPAVINQLALFETVILRRDIQGNPGQIFLRPIVNHTNLLLSPDEWLFAISQRLKSTVIQSLRHLGLGTDDEIAGRVGGVLQMIDLENPNPTTTRHSDRQRKQAHTEMTINQITPDSIAEIFDRGITQYNDSRTPARLEWAFWLDYTTIFTGSGGNAPYLVGLYKESCKDLPNISCAAAAITCWMIHNTDNYPEIDREKMSRETNIRKWRIAAYELQQAMGWSKETTIKEVLQVIRIYPSYRIVIIDPFCRDSSRHSQDGPEYIHEMNGNKIIYLYIELKSKHFCTVSTPNNFIQKLKKNDSIVWCHSCIGYDCEDCGRVKYKRKIIVCKFCNLETYDLEHDCYFKVCRYCHYEYKRGVELSEHRCPIRKDIKSIPKDFQKGLATDNPKANQLWAYDFESAREAVFNDNSSFDFPTDEDGYYQTAQPDPENPIEEMPINNVAPMYKQLPNFIVYQNVFTGELRMTESVDTFLDDMLINVNDGKNVVVAHNASGYDSRLIFDAVNTRLGQHEKDLPDVIANGTKFIRLTVKNTNFTDSLLHLQGSLKSLAADYCQGDDEYESMEKGYFPHLFNTPQNRRYIGPTPDIKYYDLTSFCNDDEELEKFYTYYNSIKHRTDWNMWEELTKYCIQDVKILSTIMKKHHELCTMAMTKYSAHLNLSPWHYTTAASYVHAIFLYNMELDEGTDKQPTKEEGERRASNSWCQLVPQEHYFAHGALRGGRTETRMHLYEGPILDIDICSQYPSVQLKKTLEICGETIPILYPVGYPTVEIHDLDYYPCNIHYTNPDEICSCDRSLKQRFLPKLRIKHANPPDIHQYIQEFFGFIMVDVTPPTDLYHPVLPVFDNDTHKCTFSLEPITRKTFASPELQLAIRKGYVVTKIYRADRYKSAPSKWSGEDGGLLGALTKLKIMSSSKVPPLEQQQEMSDYYKEHFDMSFDYNPELWDKRPAAKKTNKVLINSVWGKQCETVDHDKTTIVTPAKPQNGDLLMKSFTDNVNNLSFFIPISNQNLLVKYRNVRDGKTKPNLSKAYLPCGVFVPMYGRMMLYNVLDMYQRRVIMMDTDSIKVTKSEDPNFVDVPLGNHLGQWEDESIGDPLVGFISLGPKTYGQKHASGKTKFKCKGVNLKRAHQKQINYEKAIKIYREGYEVAVPQTVFSYRFGDGIFVKHFLKVIKFNESQLKGKLDRSQHLLFPFGYTGPF